MMPDPARYSSGIRKGNNRHHISPGIMGSVLFFFLLPSIYAQVGPAEIKDPRLKEAEQAYLPQLMELNETISAMKFPFQFSLNRHVGLDPKDQAGADKRGLEFVIFHEREILKFSGNYNAAFSVESLTPNQRAGRVLNDVILPMLRLLPDRFNKDAAFDAFGFEIGYHVRRHASTYEYEGKEILVVVLDKPDALRYGTLKDDAQRQEILNSSEIFLNGAPFGLALNAKSPFEIEALVRRPAAKKAPASEDQGAPKQVAQNESVPSLPKSDTQTTVLSTSSKTPGTIESSPTPAGGGGLDALETKYRAELESLRKEGIAKYHFVEYAPVSFVVFRKQPALQATLRNPQAYDRDATSIYRRAARTFDLFLAPQLKGILEKVPESSDFYALDFTVVLDLTAPNSPKSSEAIEFILPLKATRQFVAADITNQDLINESVVLVNGVRIGLNLAQVE